MVEKNNKRRFWLGLITILIIYSLYYLLLADSPKSYSLHRAYRYFFKMLVVLLVYGCGTYFLKGLSQKWIKEVWHIIHITLITALLALWAWHFGIKNLPGNLRNLGYSIHEFLISPLLYLATGLIGSLEERNPQEPKANHGKNSRLF